MKKHILCFGDSNTWGYVPGEGTRYPDEVRWPGVLEREMGPDFKIIEEGLSGRTTAFSDRMEPERCGLDHVLPIFASHLPLDYAVVMLGTNDTKTHFHVNAGEIGYGMEELLLRIRYVVRIYGCDPKILLVAPVPGWMNDDPMYDESSYAKSLGLAAVYEQLAIKHDCLFLDAGKVTNDLGVDGCHLTEEGHEKLGVAVADIIKADLEKENG